MADKFYAPVPHEVLPPANEPEPIIPEFTQPAPITEKDNLDKVMSVDAKLMHESLVGITHAWKHATAIDEICKLALTTAKMIQMRRRLLLMPDAAQTTKSSEGIIIPLD